MRNFQNMFKVLLKSILILVSSIFIVSCVEDKKDKRESEFTNALADETSPYLLQHAHNPVNWKPWSEDVFNDAEKENKLVIISIGYSSCHWCHVMEEETFSDKEVAKLMNENFINIKVDREERPDVDDIYMTAVQLINGSGGWPLNVIALPTGKPLYGGTYHSKAEWENVLSKINTLYQSNPEQAREYANNLTNGIQEVYQIKNESSENNFNSKDLQSILATSKLQWDTIFGGYLNSQKFMLPADLDFLLDYGTIHKDSSVLKQLKLSLDNIATRGVFDHVDGGFFRYSTDEKWQIPHFEKMLYDNAQLISTYSKAYKVYLDPLYKDVVLKTIAFLNTTLKHTTGAYFASLDAGAEEGAYYLWSEEELASLITENFELFKSYFSIEKSNRLENGKYHLFKSESDAAFAQQNSMTNDAFQELKKRWIKALTEVKSRRNLPNIDDKIIVSWNALMITGYVDAYSAFGDETYLQSAMSTFETLKLKAFKNGRLVHSYKPKSKGIDGFLEDYAFMQKAALNLYCITADEAYLSFAEKLKHNVFSEFSDDESIMFRYSNNEKLISKVVKTNDGVMPSANAIIAKNFFLLGHLNYEKKFLERSSKMLQAIVPYAKENPTAFSNWNSLLLNTTSPFYEVAVVGKDAQTKLLSLGKIHNPNSLIVGSTKPSNSPLFKNRFVDAETYIYVCRDNTCKLPVKTAEEAVKQLSSF